MTAPSRADEAQQLLGAAERYRVVFTILTRDAQAPAEIALFLAQQALEKSIKAVLAARSVVFRRTHDLLLESLALAAGLTLPVSHDLLARLGPTRWSSGIWARRWFQRCHCSRPPTLPTHCGIGRLQLS